MEKIIGLIDNDLPETLIGDDQFENNGTTYIQPGIDISQHLLVMS